MSAESGKSDRSGEDRRKGQDPNYDGPERRSGKDRRTENNRQFSTFYVAGQLYGIEAIKVQEVTKSLPMTPVPLSPQFVHGLINIRGQISTAISLRDLFGLTEGAPEDQMNVVCDVDENLLSFLVDRIGDVMEVAESGFEPAPDTVPHSVRRFMEGVYKIQGSLLSVLEVEKILEVIHKSSSSAPSAGAVNQNVNF